MDSPQQALTSSGFWERFGEFERRDSGQGSGEDQVGMKGIELAKTAEAQSRSRRDQRLIGASPGPPVVSGEL